jgi:hypothetical protein
VKSRPSFNLNFTKKESSASPSHAGRVLSHSSLSLTELNDRVLVSPKTFSHLQTSSPSQILPFLFLGNESDASDIVKLESLGITHILSITNNPFHFPPMAKSNEEPPCLKRKNLPAADSCKQNILQYFNEAFDFIGEYLSIVYLDMILI